VAVVALLLVLLHHLLQVSSSAGLGAAESQTTMLLLQTRGFCLSCWIVSWVRLVFSQEVASSSSSCSSVLSRRTS
jgi:hypothetical protein